MSSPGTSTGGAVAPSLERVVAEAFVKAACIVLESRIYRPKPVQAQAKGRAWFNLEVEEVQGASQALERWRRETGLPLVLEVFLQPWGAAHGAQQAKVETLLERWVVHYYPQLPDGPSHLSRSQLSRLNPSSVYKRLVITLRSLYTFVRVLPAYRMYRACKRQRGANFTLGYRLHSTLPSSADTATRGSRRMQHFKFGAVDTPYGQLRISVDYQPASTVTILEQTTSPPPLPQIIADYVGSPVAAQSRPPLRHALSASTAVGWATASPPTHGSAARQEQQQPAALHTPQRGAQPGSSPRSAPGHAGGLPMRRSWSTSMRGASPYRAWSQPGSELPSPVSARDTPVGSAPQHQVSLPAMLRALSMPPSRHAASSPGSAAKPPLAKPPRGHTAPLAATPGSHQHSGSLGRLVPVGSSPLSGNLSAAVVEEGDEEEGSDSGSPGGSANSAPRQTSKPVSIPGRCAPSSGGAGRRLRSSGDLWALQQAAAAHKPLSAPAVSHMPAAQAAPGAGTAEVDAGLQPRARSTVGRSGATRGREPAPSPTPDRRLAPIPGLESESSGSAASSLYPTSCSPQLPFAFTPSAQSLGSFGARGPLQESARLERVSPRLGRTLSNNSTGGGGAAPQAGSAPAHPRSLSSGGGGAPAAPAAGFSPSGGGGAAGGAGVTGREVPASLALMRRPSWSSRSSGYALPGEASQPTVGYSVSPMQDLALESMLAGSTPRQFALAGALPPQLVAQGMAGVGGPPLGGRISRAGSSASGFGAAPPLLTFPSLTSPEHSGALDEADVLPFALDEAGSAAPLKPLSTADATPDAPGQSAAAPRTLNSREQPAPGGERLTSARPAAAASSRPPPASVAVVDADAAVGAFVRLIQEAPPLRMHAARLAGRAASADLSSAALNAAAPGSSSDSDTSAATCLSDGRGMTLQAGLRQFNRIKQRLQQRGVVVGPSEA